MPDTGVPPPISPSVILGPLHLISLETLSQSPHGAAADTARRPGARTGRPVRVVQKHTVPQASPQLPARTPESRGSKLNTSSLRGACKVSKEPSRWLHLPHLLGAGELKLRGRLPQSVLQALLSCRKLGSISLFAPFLPCPPQAITTIPRALQKQQAIARAPNPWAGWGAGSAGQRAPRPRCPGRTL